MGIMHDPHMPFSEAHSFNLVGTHRILDLCVRHGVKKVVVLSSANVYGPRPDNSNFLVEETPLMAADRFSDVRDLIELDMYAQSFMWKHPEIETVILRPVNIVGPTVRNAPSNYLRLEVPITRDGLRPHAPAHPRGGRLPRAGAGAAARACAASSTSPGRARCRSPRSCASWGAGPSPSRSRSCARVVRRAFEARLTSLPARRRSTTSSTCAWSTARASRARPGGSPATRCGETIRSVL